VKDRASEKAGVPSESAGMPGPAAGPQLVRLVRAVNSSLDSGGSHRSLRMRPSSFLSQGRFKAHKRPLLTFEHEEISSTVDRLSANRR
jgi:hypothetical protein